MYKNIRTPPASTADFFGSVESASVDLDGFEFVVFDDQVLPLGELVAADLVLGVERLASFLIDELLTHPIAGRLVDLPEGDAFLRSSRRRAVRSGTRPGPA